MKKNLLVGAAALLTLFGVVSCGGGYDATVLEDKENVWVTHGNFLLADGTANGWNGKEKEVYEKSALKATSVAEVAKISEDVAKALSNKEIKALYTVDVILGTNDAGWTTDCIKADGKKYKVNGSYALKVAKCSYDAADGVYSEQQWIPDPKTAHVESLTPSTYFVPTWQETADENGFSWASNPVCIGGAGTYTIIAAQYKAVSSASTAGYGIGLVKKAEGTAISEDQLVVDYVAANHTYGVIGSFAASENWAKDVAMTANEDNTSWSATVTLAAGDQFKVRADGAWDYSWGISEGEYAHKGDDGKADGNGTVAEAGDYVITISNFGKDGSAKVSVAKAA
jgi:hypothetical protein